MGVKTKEHKKKDGSFVPDTRVEPEAAEMNWGGGGCGGGRLDERGMY